MTNEKEEQLVYKGMPLIINNTGYYRVYLPKNSMASKSGMILLHRLIMSEKIGRPLTKSEVVHHIDGNPTNNEISNLELRETRKLHCTQHHRRGPYYKGILPKLSELDQKKIDQQYEITRFRMRQARRNADIGFVGLAASTGINNVSLSDIESGKTNMKFSQFLRIIYALNIKPEDLFKKQE